MSETEQQDTDESEPEDSTLPGVAVTYESEMVLDEYDLEQRIPDSIVEGEFDEADRSRVVDLLSADMDGRLRRDPIKHGEISVAFDDEAPSIEDLDLSAIGVFYIVRDTNSAGRSWLFRTTDEDDAIDQYEAVVGNPPERIYYEGTLKDALQELLIDNCALLAQ